MDGVEREFKRKMAKIVLDSFIYDLQFVCFLNHLKKKATKKRLWFSCWLFGAVLAILSFLIAFNPADKYFILVGLIFLGFHVVGLFKYVKPLG